MNIFDIAKICHEANASLCETHGDDTQEYWEKHLNGKENPLLLVLNSIWLIQKQETLQVMITGRLIKYLTVGLLVKLKTQTSRRTPA